MKGPRYRALKFAISAKLLPQKKNLIVQIERATYDAPKKKKEWLPLEPHWSILQIILSGPQICVRWERATRE